MICFNNTKFLKKSSPVHTVVPKLTRLAISGDQSHEIQKLWGLYFWLSLFFLSLPPVKPACLL